MYVLTHYEQGSKLKAGTWAVGQFPKWQDLIQRALRKAGLSNASTDFIEETYKEVTVFVDEMIQHIQDGK